MSTAWKAASGAWLPLNLGCRKTLCKRTPAASTLAREQRRSAGRLHEFLRRRRPFPEEELLHLELETFAMRRLDRRQSVFVDEHDLVFDPLLPCLLRHVLEDAFAELAGIGRTIE